MALIGVWTTKERGFQPPWHHVKHYRCDCGTETRVRVNWKPVGLPPRGGFRCSGCGETIRF